MSATSNGAARDKRKRAIGSGRRFTELTQVKFGKIASQVLGRVGSFFRNSTGNAGGRLPYLRTVERQAQSFADLDSALLPRDLFQKLNINAAGLCEAGEG